MNYRQFFKVIKSLQDKMPKCLNDATKTYKGDEPSPKGLGYAAGNEAIGHKMRGKDGNMWIVQETKTCKKWAKCKDEPGVFCKLQQPSVSPAAPHPGQALLGAAEDKYQ